MNKKRAHEILDKLEKYYPQTKIALNFSNNFELLVSVILSAQTTDAQVNKVTEKLFPKYRLFYKKYSKVYNKYRELKPKSEITEMINFSHAQLENLESDIKSIGLYKRKAKNIKETSQILLTKYNGSLPKKIEKLTTLPGVGRKTANVVLGVAFGIIEGIAVDTHVKRLSLKYGFTKEKDPQKIEKDLMALFSKKDWIKLTLVLIEHGRALRRGEKDFIDLRNQ